MTVDTRLRTQFAQVPLDHASSDLFVMSFPDIISADVIDRLKEQWERYFKHRGFDPIPHLMVLGSGGRLEVVRFMPDMTAGDLGLESPAP